MCMRDSSVHAGGFRSVVNRPFGLVQKEVDQDPAPGPIRKRADRTVDLARLVLAHSASLSVHVGGVAWPPAAETAWSFLCSTTESFAAACSSRGLEGLLASNEKRHSAEGKCDCSTPYFRHGLVQNKS